jgi:hypothetical protein
MLRIRRSINPKKTLAFGFNLYLRSSAFICVPLKPLRPLNWTLIKSDAAHSPINQSQKDSCLWFQSLSAFIRVHLRPIKAFKTFELDADKI